MNDYSYMLLQVKVAHVFLNTQYCIVHWMRTPLGSSFPTLLPVAAKYKVSIQTLQRSMIWAFRQYGKHWFRAVCAFSFSVCWQPLSPSARGSRGRAATITICQFRHHIVNLAKPLLDKPGFGNPHQTHVCLFRFVEQWQTIGLLFSTWCPRQLCEFALSVFHACLCNWFLPFSFW